MPRNHHRLVVVAILAVSMAVPTWAAISKEPARVQSGHLTEASTDSALEIATNYLATSAGDYGLSSGDLSDSVLKDQYRTESNGVTHVYFRQRLNGIEVVNADSNINIDRQGRVFFAGSRYVSGLAGKVNAGNPAIAPLAALISAAKALELQPKNLELLQNLGGTEARAVFSPGGLSLEEIPVKLMYLPTDRGDV
jgi:extracellular elastinolytic metalloproteinase